MLLYSSDDSECSTIDDDDDCTTSDDDELEEFKSRQKRARYSDDSPTPILTVEHTNSKSNKYVNDAKDSSVEKISLSGTQTCDSVTSYGETSSEESPEIFEKDYLKSVNNNIIKISGQFVPR